MKITYDEQWTIERDDGSVIRLAANEASLLYDRMLRNAMWDNVVMRFAYDSHWNEIEDARDDILDELLYDDDSEMSDRVYNAVCRWAEIDEEE